MSTPERRAPPSGGENSLGEPISHGQLRDLVRDSIGTAFLSQTSYTEIVGDQGCNFQPSQFDPIRVVRVQTREGPKLLIQDGHHRAQAYLDMLYKYRERLEEVINDYNQLQPPDNPPWKPLIRNVTRNYSDISSSEEEPIISMQRYLEILAPHTKKTSRSCC